MSHTLTANLFLRYLNAAAVTDGTLVSDALILSAKALPVLGRSENTLAEKSVALRFKSTIVDRFGLFDLTV